MALLLALQIVLLGAFSSIAAQTGGDNASVWELAPLYLASFGTVAAFTVTALLFKRGTEDRVREQASKVYVFSQEDEDAGEVVATVHNRSDLPVWRVEAFPKRGKDIVTEDIFPSRPDLEPGGTTEVRWKPAQENDSIERDWRLRFVDASGREWIREGNLLKLQRTQRFLRSS